eukprot:TRINITY_DN21835_c0_g1_i1.p1 TRINITY_DN21835_c0_g1~~TRINITY_DN21835_c0_g1_i1.p1  ORF type:complete len:602 (-),score=43.87 TRINITY_DN21835_c0_g1_i1:107-1912(-)
MVGASRLFRSALFLLQVQSYRLKMEETTLLEPNPPTWPESVKVFGPENTTETINEAVQQAYSLNGGQYPADNGQWSDQRFAFLFKPGTYHNVEVPVGYYTQVAGLGLLPSDVTFESQKGVYCDEANPDKKVGGLNTFWRSAENFRTKAYAGMRWAASQATPLRRVEVMSDLMLYQNGYVSGGFLANSQIRGKVDPGGQQQYFTRNTVIDGCWQAANWNMVFTGVKGAPSNSCGKPQVINVKDTPVVAEKPFISFDDAIQGYKLNIPNVRYSSSGVDWTGGNSVDFSNVYVASPDKDDAFTINSKLQSVKYVVLSPGIYQLFVPINIRQNGTVLLGLGLATLKSMNGNACITVGNVAGVRIAGILVAAGPSSMQTNYLVRVGESKWAGSSYNPVFLQDLFVRVGDHHDKGSNVNTMLEINTGYTIGDNLWLWRADHTQEDLVRHGDNPSQVGLVVNADHVTMLGLSAEHSLKDQVQWNGNSGETYFLQVELPYDWPSGTAGDAHTGYRVAPSVRTHKAYGIGIYHFFRDSYVSIDSGVVVPSWLESQIFQPFAVFLNGKGVLNNVINQKGGQTVLDWVTPGKNPHYVCDYIVPQDEQGTGCR